MGFKFNPLSADGFDIDNDSGGGSITLGSTVIGSDPNRILKTDSAGNLDQTAALNDGQVVIGSTGNAPVVANIAGTANRVTVTNGAGSITVSGPQDIHSGATPTFVTTQLTGLTANRAVQSDGSSNLSSSAVTSTELGYVSGVTSAIQTQINSKISSTEKGANNGVATLDAGGKVPVAQLPNSVMEYQGAWNATTNTPALADGVGNTGDVYRVSVAGTQNLGSGPITFAVADFIIYNGTIWEKSPAADAVVSVNGQQGLVILDTDDISEGTNQYFTDERAQDAIGTILTDTSTIDFTYNDAGNAISAVVLPAGVDHNSLLNYVANEHIDHSTVQIATAATTSGLTGGGDITATLNLSVDINGTTAETVTDNADKILIYDNSTTSLKSMTRANFLSGIATSSSGDINETSFAGANNVVAATDVTGFAFANGVVRSFKALVSVYVNATTPLYEALEITGIQKAASWDIVTSSAGDASQVSFSITTGGQIQYTSGNYTGFTALTVKFRAISTSI